MADVPTTVRGEGGRRACHALALGNAAVAILLVAGCAAPPGRVASSSGRYYDSRLGVYASPKIVADGEPVPRGGGNYLVGRPYTIGGRVYVPSEQPTGYVAVGTASWYGDAFHGRRTANGEVFDKNSISAAHPTLPLPSYVRVTNLGNGRSMIVRVNDRGPYHGGRVMDVSQRVAEALNFRMAGTARIRVEYVGRASLRGSDDEKLIATLRMDGGPAQIADAGGLLGATGGDTPSAPPPIPAPPRTPVARVETTGTGDETDGAMDGFPAERPLRRRPVFAPVPPQRPFELSDDAQPDDPRAPSPPPARYATRPPPPKFISFSDPAN